MGSNIFIWLLCHKKIQSPTSLKTEAASYYSCRTGFLWITVPKLCELFPGFLSCTLCPAHVFDFTGCLPAFPAASELGVSAPQPRAHPLLCLHIQTPHDPWKNVLTGIYQIPMLSVPFSVLTLGFWDSWFLKRPLTVKLNKGWGSLAGQELLLNLHHSFLAWQPGWHPLSSAGDPLERLQPSVLQHPVVSANASRAARAGSPIPASLLSAWLFWGYSPTHTKGRSDTSFPWKGWTRMGPNSFCCQCGGWEYCPQPQALQEHKMSDFNQHRALVLMRMLARTLKSLNSSTFGVLCCQA